MFNQWSKCNQNHFFIDNTKQKKKGKPVNKRKRKRYGTVLSLPIYEKSLTQTHSLTYL